MTYYDILRTLCAVMTVSGNEQNAMDTLRTRFSGDFDDATILKWLRSFYRRFFTQQFKRSCLPDGPKVGSVTLSPRGDWRMPSDACAAVWQAELEKLH